MTTLNNVKKIMDNLVQDAIVIELKKDDKFIQTVAEQYDEYVEINEGEGEESCSLEDYTIDKIEWLEENK